MTAVGGNKELRIAFFRTRIIAATFGAKLYLASATVGDNTETVGVALWFPPGIGLFDT